MDFRLPALGEGIDTATVTEILVKPGDTVKPGQAVLSVETDKATMEWESPEDGTLSEIYVQEGGKVDVGDKIAFIRGEGEETPKQEAPEQKKQERLGRHLFASCSRFRVFA